MQVTVQIIEPIHNERVIIQCHKITGEIDEIRRYIKSRNTVIEAYQDASVHHVPLHDIYYVEAVDNHVFIYLSKDVYEIKMKLYEFEENFKKESFFRCSKQNIINLMKITDITPALNGRFQAKMLNGEIVIISRRYVSDLQKKLRGDRS